MAALRRKSRPRPVSSPWGLGGLSLRDLAWRVYRRLWEDEIFDRAAGLSYYFSFALFPMLLFLTALFGMLPFPNAMSHLLAYADRVLPSDAAAFVHRALGQIVLGSSRSLLSVGVLAALWGASSGMRSIMTALRVAYRVVDPRPWWRSRIVAIALTFGFSLFTLTALLLLVFGRYIGEIVAGEIGLGPEFRLAWAILHWPMAMLLVLTGLAFVYWLAPAGGRRWHWITPGSIFSLVAWLLMSTGLRLYVGSFGHYNATYGSIGGVILLLLWLYLSGIALLVGAEINSAVEDAAAQLQASRTSSASKAEPGPRRSMR